MFFTDIHQDLNLLCSKPHALMKLCGCYGIDEPWVSWTAVMCMHSAGLCPWATPVNLNMGADLYTQAYQSCHRKYNHKHHLTCSTARWEISETGGSWRVSSHYPLSSKLFSQLLWDYSKCFKRAHNIFESFLKVIKTELERFLKVLLGSYFLWLLKDNCFPTSLFQVHLGHPYPKQG